MWRRWLVLTLIASGCIEYPDPNECNVDSQCDDGRLCSAMYRCEKAADLVDITVRWTFGGVAPTPDAPGGCASFDSMMVGASDVGGSGFGNFVECTAGSAQLAHVPWDMTLIGGNGYRSIGNGASEVVGSAEIDRADTTDVTLLFALP
jgi:hypothetical protein